MALYTKIFGDLELYLPLWFPGGKKFNFLFNNNNKKNNSFKNKVYK